VVLPAGNEPELELLPQEVRERVRFVPVRTMDEVLDAAIATRGEISRDTGALPSISADPGVQISQ
jgi:ATP-dependent Lon protease